MKLKPKITIADYFDLIEDRQVERTKQHKLIDIVTIAICAVICGADSWVSIANYGDSKYELKGFLELPNGIPSHDTFARVFAQYSEKFQECFLNWIQSIRKRLTELPVLEPEVRKITVGQVVAIDGKTLRHSNSRGADKGAIHMVSAWATENRLVLGQLKVAQKSNEISAIPELLEVLELAGCIVTIDAKGSD